MIPESGTVDEFKQALFDNVCATCALIRWGGPETLQICPKCRQDAIDALDGAADELTQQNMKPVADIFRKYTTALSALCPDDPRNWYTKRIQTRRD